MSRQPVPGEVWTTPDRDAWTCLALIPDHPELFVWKSNIAHLPFVSGSAKLTPPPEFPPAKLVARVRGRWINVAADGYTSEFYDHRNANDFAAEDRAWLIHPDGRWQKCKGKDVIGEPVEVPR